MNNKIIYFSQATLKVAGTWRLGVVILALVALVGASNGDIIFKDGFENHPPDISSSPPTTVVINTLYSYDVAATDVDGDLLTYSLSISPDGMTVGELNGEIRWTPDQLGLFDIELQVTDGSGGSDQQQWRIEVQAVLDSDKDGLSDAEEMVMGTNPHDPDTDDDGLEDGEEANFYNTNPLDADGDDDGLKDGSEIKIHSTHPGKPDTDNDTYRDGEEIDYGTDPLDPLDFPVNVVPEDPADVAPEIDPTVATTVFDSTEFLYRGLNRVQTGVGNDVIEPERAAVIRGKVMSRDGAGLSGVLVTIHGHPEFGETLSRADGGYDMVVNGGGYLTVNLGKESYLPAHRQVEVSWQSWVATPDVVLVQLDTKQTVVDLAQTGMQVARGSVVSDDRGARQNTLLIPEGTVAEMVLPDGSTQPLSTLTISATEYSTGANGESAMPAQLPPGIGYTYCAELSVAEAADAGAGQVRFNQPVPNYLENFMGLPAGAEVPAYYYDKARAVWVSTPPGKVIDIIGETGGLIDLDTDGDGLADDIPMLDALGITEPERQQLAGLYGAGDSIWRVQLEHFSTIDYNYPYPWPPSYYPQTPNPQSALPEEENCNERAASTVACQSQSLGEAIPIVGTPYSLHYSSDRTQGRISSRQLSIPVAGKICEETRVWVNVAGTRYLETMPCDGEDRVFEFTWDGTDAYGREVSGADVEVGMAYVYTAFRRIRKWNEAANEWTVIWQPAPPVLDALVSEPWKGKLINPDERQFGLGGWSVNVHHRYESVPRLLSYGNGSGRSSEAIGQVINKKWISDRSRFHGLDVGADGTVYLANYRYHSVLAIGPNHSGTFAGKYSSSTPTFNGDGILATEAYLRNPRDTAVGPDGSVYIADTGFARVRRVDREGLIWTVAGNGEYGEPCEGCPATETAVSNVIKIDVGPDGTLYLVRQIPQPNYDVVYRVYMVSTDGIITTAYAPHPIGVSGYSFITDLEVGPQNTLYVAQHSNCSPGYCGGGRDQAVVKVWPTGEVEVVAGNGTAGFSGDGGPAVDAQLYIPNGVTLGPDQSVYIADAGNKRIRKVTPEGIISTVAGCGDVTANCLWTNDYGLFSTVTYLLLNAISHGPEGLHVVSNGGERVLKMDPPLPGVTEGEIMLPDKSGTRVFYFEGNGRHLRTSNSLTGATIHHFSYDSDGLLTQIRDGDGDITIFERDAAGNPTAIIGPYGQRTELSIDANGYLASITNPNSEFWQFAYTDDGLLTSSTNPNKHASTYDYDSLGRLVQTLDAAGGSHTLVRTELENGYEVSRTTALGKTTTYRIENLSTGDRLSTNIFPDGTESQTVTGTDGLVTYTGPEGTTVLSRQIPDSRFGMMSPLSGSFDIQTPGGIIYDTTREESTILSNTNDPLSLQSRTDTLDANGRTYTSFFDADTMQFIDTKPSGRELLTSIDPQGRVTERVVSGMAPVSFEYDAAGRMVGITRGTGEAAREFWFSYGPNGYISEIEDPLSRTHKLFFDPAGKLISYELPDTRTIQYGYDALGNTVSIQPPGRSAHQFEYNPVNLQLAYTPPDLGTGDPHTSYVYSKDRRLLKATRPDGKTVDLSYNNADRLETVTIPRGTYTYTYDPTTGQISSIMAPDGGTLSVSYDGTLITEAVWAGTISGAVNRSYNNDLQVTSRSINAAHLVELVYNDDGLLSQAGNLVLSRDTGNGRVVGSELGNVVDSRVYNGFGEPGSYLADYGGTPLIEFQYSRDKLGRITEMTETIGTTTHSYEYEYDLAGRLLQVSEDSVVVSTYTYDDNNNRLSGMSSGGSASGTFDAQDRLLQYGNASYTYSLNGELATKTIAAQTTTYTYDTVGNLVDVTVSGGDQVTYVLDGVNRRIGKKINGTLVQGFLYKDLVNPIAELDETGAVKSRFVYASNVHVPDYMIRNGTTYRILTDHLGSPRMVVDVATGTIAQQIVYDEFGNILSDTNPGFQPFGFAGGLYDPATRLTRFGVRDYDPETGRWLSRDPSRFRHAETNLYEYGRSDPVNRIDPLGSTSESASAADQELSTIPDLSWESLGDWVSDTAQDVAQGQVRDAVAEALGIVAEVEFASWVGSQVDTVNGVIGDIFRGLDDYLEVEAIVNDPNRSEAEQGAGILSCLRERSTSFVGRAGPVRGAYSQQVVDMAIGVMEFAVEYIGMIREGHAERAMQQLENID